MNGPIVVKFCTEHGGITTVLCAKFQNDWTIKTCYARARFEFRLSFGRISYIAQHPRVLSIPMMCGKVEYIAWWPLFGIVSWYTLILVKSWQHGCPTEPGLQMSGSGFTEWVPGLPWIMIFLPYNPNIGHPRPLSLTWFNYNPTWMSNYMS